MNLREKIARTISEALGDWDELGVLPRHTAAADAILSIPELRDALETHAEYKDGCQVCEDGRG
jgi:hypothetical protein